MRLWWDAALGVVRRDALLYFSYRSQVFTQIFSLFINLSLFYFISRLLTSKTFGTPDEYFAFVVIGLVIMDVLVSTLGQAPGAVRQELVAGTLERLIVSSFGVRNGIVAMLLFPIVASFVTGTVILAIAAVVFGMPIASTAPLAIPVAVLGIFAFAPFSLGLVAAVIAFKQTASGIGFLTSGLAIVGGLYFPVSLLPGWVRWASDVQPFTPAADLLRHLLVDAPLQSSVLVDVVKLFAFGAVLLPVSLFMLRRSIVFGQRRGTIIEY